MLFCFEGGVSPSRNLQAVKYRSQPIEFANPGQPEEAAPEQFTGMEGKYVPIKETVRSFKEILEGQHDDIPEQMFLFAGSIDEVVEKYEKSKKA